tara:strand:- start:169 stop:447 length:279 start_codon:yes stop_codon:yes gene_type:complete
MKMKTIVFAMEVPKYWDSNDIIEDHEEDEYGNAGSVSQMLQKTLIFAEKKFNKRNDGEGHATGMIISSDYDLKKLKQFVEHLEGNGGSLYHV